jgi:hypothetical protein
MRRIDLPTRRHTTAAAVPPLLLTTYSPVLLYGLSRLLLFYEIHVCQEQLVPGCPNP